MNQEIKLEQLTSIFAGKKVFLVGGKSFDQLDIKEDIEKACDKLVKFCDFSPNPMYEDVCKGVELFNQENCNAILAVGGGSAIDVAKCIKLFAPMDSRELYLNQKFVESKIPFAAIPTTAGSGSESTRHVVIYYLNNKQSISHDMALPDFYVLDPSVLKSLPLYQRKCTMLDALCQGIESWWSINSTEESIRYSKQAVQLIVDNWKEYINENTIDSAAHILRASNCAGKAINITSTTAAHAMSYKITTLFGIPHGHSVAICMIYVWEYLINNMNRCVDIRGEDYLRCTLDSIHSLLSLDGFRDFVKELGMSYPITNNRVSQVEILTKSVNPDRLKNYPVVLSEEEIRKMYMRIFD